MKSRLVVLSAALLFLAGCATAFPVGSIYTEIALPVVATSNTGKALKTGTAECKSILAVVALGDCSIAAAKRQGNITRVQHVDWQAENILGVIGKYKVIVYGD